MKKSIFITGVAGSGKSSISEQLNKLGYKAYDIEDIDGMFKMVRKDTKEDFEDYDNADIEKVKNADWICDKKKLEEFLNKQKNETTYYCGIASNNADIISLFSEMVLLKASPETIVKRLSGREGTDDMGNTKENREHTLSWKGWWEEKMIQQGAIVVDANKGISEVTQEIVGLDKAWS